MSDERCPQAGLIEALHDGRLGASEAASMQRHLPTCSSCRAQQQELAAIRAALRAPVAPLTPLEHQRARIALLRSAAGGPAVRTGPSPRWLLAVGLVVAASAAAGVATWGPAIWQEPAPAPRPVVARAPAVVTEEPGSALVTAGGVRTVPAHGAKPEVAPPVVEEPVAVPVAPVAPAVPGVSVDVALSGADRGGSGERVRHRRPRRVDASSPVLVPTGPAIVVAQAPPPVEVVQEPPLPVPPSPPVVSPASRDFAGAMDALGGGDFGLAARRFAAFAAAWPADPRSDEAAYLIAIAHERAGRVDAARAAAQRYLRDRPTGAHRAQAAKLAGGG